MSYEQLVKTIARYRLSVTWDIQEDGRFVIIGSNIIGCHPITKRIPVGSTYERALEHAVREMTNQIYSRGLS